MAMETIIKYEYQTEIAQDRSDISVVLEVQAQTVPIFSFMLSIILSFILVFVFQWNFFCPA